MQQDEVGDALYILEHGILRVTIRGPDGALVVERNVEAPAIVGEMALLTGERRSATVMAAIELRVLRMEKPDFQRLCTEFSANCRVSDVSGRRAPVGEQRHTPGWQVSGRGASGCRRRSNCF